MKCPKESLQNLSYFLEYKKNHVVSFFLKIMLLYLVHKYFHPNTCPGLYRYIPGHFLGKK